MTFTRWITLTLTIACVAGVMGVTGCVSPFYGTARIEEGHSFSIGAAASSHLISLGECTSHDYGWRSDVEYRYGFNEHWQINARFGTGSGSGGRSLESVAPPSRFHEFIDPSIGLQYAFQKGYVTPALRLEVCLTPGFIAPSLSPTLLVGFGRKEWLTVGNRMKLMMGVSPYAVESFVGIHPIRNLTIFAGIDWLSSLDKDFPLIGAAGLSYNFRIGRKKDEDN